jgi:hypothetical protein
MLYCVCKAGTWFASLEMDGIEYCAMGNSAASVIGAVLKDSQATHVWNA